MHVTVKKDGLVLVLERFTLIATEAINRFRQEEEGERLLTFASGNEHSKQQTKNKGVSV
jgi:hypothetical protein